MKMIKSELDYAIDIRNRIILDSSDNNYFYGYIEQLRIEDFEMLDFFSKKNLLIIFNSNTNTNINIDKISDYFNCKINIEFKYGDIDNYYVKISDFIEGNKFQNNKNDYYISELNFRLSKDNNELIDKYYVNQKLINFLIDISDYKKDFGNSLELFFYKISSGINIKIDYSNEDLARINFSISDKLINEILEPINGSDKKQLFINELISYLEKNGNSYHHLIEGWDNLISYYDKSYSLFLAGFSFDKIKTASTEYFDSITNKIYDSISKVSNYIFGIPIGYILVLNNFDFSGNNLLKNFGLLLVSTIFFIMIRIVLFKNINESIIAIEVEIDEFLFKIINYSELDIIKNKLVNLKNFNVKSQREKLNMMSLLTTIIYTIIILIFIFLFFDKSIYSL